MVETRKQTNTYIFSKVFVIITVNDVMKERYTEYKPQTLTRRKSFDRTGQNIAVFMTFVSKIVITFV